VLAEGENNFGYESKWQDGRAKKGCIVIGMDYYFNGERKSTGPAGKIEQILSRLYKLYGKPDEFRTVIYRGTSHVYTGDEQQKMVDWFHWYLAGGQS